MEKKISTLKDQNQPQIQDLITEIQQKNIHPLDHYEVSALLESFGWNDDRARKTFGVKDVFELSMLIWSNLDGKIQAQAFTEEEKIPLGKRIMTVLQSFIRGLIFALPMAISVAAMLTIRLSLWSYEYLDVEQATSIALGTILSFVTVGGFTQAIARRGFFYLNQGFYNMAKRFTYYLVRLGYIVSLIVAALFYILNLYYKNFPFYMIIISVLYYLFLCSNWLSITVMYMLRREFQFAALITFGIGLVAVLFYFFQLNIILSQIIALTVISGLGLLLVIHMFNIAEQKEERGIAPPMPKKSIVLYAISPYFLYGFLYFAFIYIDRIMAWSTNNDNAMPYIIWFRGEYELGLDFALLMLIIPMGLNEIIVTSLMKKLENAQKSSFSHEMDSLKTKYLKPYVKSMVLVSAGAVVSAMIVLFVIYLLRSGRFENLSKVYNFSYITNFVFYFAMVAYGLVSASLMNVVLLFSLSQPEPIIRSLSVSLLVNFAVGFICSRWFGYYYAVFGLLAGSIVFLILSTKCILKVFNNLDYYVYAAL